MRDPVFLSRDGAFQTLLLAQSELMWLVFLELKEQGASPALGIFFWSVQDRQCLRELQCAKKVL